MKKHILSILTACLAAVVFAQQPIQVGKGSYAEYTPLYKSRTQEHGGDLSRFMETRKLYITEKNQGKPIPTNDWWTNIITDQYSGNLWSYPQVVNAEEYGIYVGYPKDWEDTGHELKWKSQLEITGKRFKPASADLDSWHDWGFGFLMKDNEKEMSVTLAHGMPFTWVETKNLEVQLRTKNATYYSKNGALQLPYTGSEIAVQIGDDVYGVYVPTGTVFSEKNGLLEVAFSSPNQQYLSIGVLPERSDLMTFAEYAYVIPRKTEVTWNYNETTGIVETKWQIQTENLKGGTQKDVLQGFIPHHYKNSTFTFPFLSYEYQTPRGKMKMAKGNSFTISYKFNGMLPYFAVPEEDAALKNPYQKERMKQLISEYADRGGFGADTYWGGKGLIQMGLYMTFAHEMGETELFEKCRKRLKDVLVNWLTYTPGENSFFFARYDRWGALVGYDTSYDSDTFNDHHFHYGYYTYAASLLALFDDDFKNNYGEMITLIAKDYANWDKNDTQFPFFRTFDPWAGHSYAGGLGDGNGNGQESTSEAMQGWGGMYLLGMATGNKTMRDAGIFGWTLESRGVAEYWFDRDKENIDYTRYPRPYNSNLTSQGIGWWTWFSGDPVWMHSIQWMPISPCQNHLYEDLEFARWDYTTMWNSKEVGDWTTAKQTEGSPASLSYESGLGNVVLSYLQIFDADSAASVFDTMWNADMPIAKNPDTGGISYYITHSHRTYGDICWDIHADIPTATTYKDAKTGKMTFVVYNPESTEKMVNFYKDGAITKTIKAPARRMTAYSDAPILTSVEIVKPASVVVEPGKTLQLKALLYDQYGATIDGSVTWSISQNQGGSISTSGLFTAGATKGTSAVITIKSGTISDNITLKVNDKPVLQSAEISPRQPYLQVGQTLEHTLLMKDQYGEVYTAPVDWQMLFDGKVVKTDSILNLSTIGKYTVKATVEGKTYSTEIFLSPTFGNIALNKEAKSSSEENAGTLTKSVNDGDYGSRWGSEHKDPQWVYIDLGTTSYVSQVVLAWEAAYSSLYEIQISDDKQSWETVETRVGLGGTETIEVNRDARYVRMYGRERATTYGHSLLEFEIYGVPPMGATPQLFGIDLQPSMKQIKEGEEITLKATGYDQFGDEMTINPTYRVISGEGTVSAQGVFRPTKYGTAVVEAKVNSLTSKATFIVEEAIKLNTISISPKRTQLVKGESITFTSVAADQFNAPFPADGITYRIRGNGGSISGATFTGDVIGDFEIIAGYGGIEDTAFVKVAELSDVNLALHKSVSVSSHENWATLPVYVNDGDYNTRWGSAFSEPEFVQVDLQEGFVIDKIKLFWDNGAYATSYRIDVSLNEEDWTTVYTQQSGRGGDETITFPEVAAQYVRLWCLKRSSGYGSSIYELEVYGKNFWRNPNPVRMTMPVNPLTAYIGETLQLEPILYDQYGLVFTPTKKFTYSINGGATIDENGLLTPSEAGDYSLTVKYDNLTSKFDTRILSEQVVSRLELSPAYTTVKVGESLDLSVKGLDQYGNEIAVTPQWQTSGGNLTNGTFTSAQAGTFEITVSLDGVSTKSTVKVIAAPVNNLALRKPVTSSSGTPNAAVDGEEGSRWESAFQDGPEWLEVDLEDAYLLTDAEIIWEGASTADYEIQVSKDGNDWATLKQATGLSNARTDKWRINGMGRYVRVWCTKRSTVWGYSIFEFRLYGEKVQEGQPYDIQFVAPVTELNINEETRYDVKVFDKNGTEIMNPELNWSVQGSGIIEDDGNFKSLFSGDMQIHVSSGMATAYLPIVIATPTSIGKEAVSNKVRAWIKDNIVYVEGEDLQEIALSDMQGRLFLKKSVSGNSCQELLPSRQQGIFILLVRTTHGLQTIKLVAK